MPTWNWQVNYDINGCTLVVVYLWIIFVFFSIRVFFHRHWWLTEQQGKGGDHLLFSRTFKNLFATLHVRWLSHIFDRNACVYQTATRWDLPIYWVTIWLIDWLMMWLLVDVILGFFYSLFDTGKAMGSNLHRHITLVLQANRLTKCTSHPKWDMEQMKYEAHHKNDK